MPSNSDAAEKERQKNLIASCAKVHPQDVPGVGKVARFDNQAVPPFEDCKALYNKGGAVADEMVRQFCNLPEFKGDNIPQRCKCYRFPDTADFDKYSSIWSQVVESAEDAKGDKVKAPFMSSYVCFYGECGNREESYLLESMKADRRSCPDTVFCKQVVGGGGGGIKVDGNLINNLVQKCGADASKPDPKDPKDPDDTKDPEDKPKGLTTGMIMAIVGVIALLVMVVFVVAVASR